jgi:hypothetical protein
MLCPNRRSLTTESPTFAVVKHLRPHPEERAPKSGLPDFGNEKVSKSATADFDARVSKDGNRHGRASGHPSRRA